MADVLHGFDLNVRMEEDDDGNLSFNLNEPILEDHNNNGNVLILTHFFLSCFLYSHRLHVTANVPASEANDEQQDVFNLNEPEDHHGGNTSLRSILSLVVYST